jgi:hypothetical protein
MVEPRKRTRPPTTPPFVYAAATSSSSSSAAASSNPFLQPPANPFVPPPPLANPFMRPPANPYHPPAPRAYRSLAPAPSPSVPPSTPSTPAVTSEVTTGSESVDYRFRRRGQHSRDSPATAAARREQEIIRRDHRTRGRAGEEVSSTPTLSQLRAGQDPPTSSLSSALSSPQIDELRGFTPFSYEAPATPTPVPLERNLPSIRGRGATRSRAMSRSRSRSRSSTPPSHCRQLRVIGSCATSASSLAATIAFIL